MELQNGLHGFAFVDRRGFSVLFMKILILKRIRQLNTLQLLRKTKRNSSMTYSK